MVKHGCALLHAKPGMRREQDNRVALGDHIVPASPRKALRAFMRSLCVSLSALFSSHSTGGRRRPQLAQPAHKLDIQIGWCPCTSSTSTTPADVRSRKILFDDACPHSLLVTRRARKTVAGQVHQVAASAQREEVQFPRPARHLAGIGQAGLACQAVN